MNIKYYVSSFRDSGGIQACVSVMMVARFSFHNKPEWMSLIYFCFPKEHERKRITVSCNALLSERFGTKKHIIKSWKVFTLVCYPANVRSEECV